MIDRTGLLRNNLLKIEQNSFLSVFKTQSSKMMLMPYFQVSMGILSTTPILCICGYFARKMIEECIRVSKN